MTNPIRRLPSVRVTSACLDTVLLVDKIIEDIDRMDQSHHYDIEKLHFYHAQTIREDVRNTNDKRRLIKKLEKIGYPFILYSKDYYCLIFLVSNNYLQSKYHSKIKYYLMTVTCNNDFVLFYEKVVRFFNIAKKLHPDLQQKLSNVTAKLSKEYVSNVKIEDYKKWLE